MSEPLTIEVIDVPETPALIELLIGQRGPAGGGTVYNVNGQTGPVVTLGASDVGAIPVDAVLSGGTY
jgi:hypothetical protein